MLRVADGILTVVHLAVIFGFVFLWIPKSTIRIHRWIVILTATSWLVLGYKYGFGYCFLTDLHWHVKRARGDTHLPGSFIKYAGDFITGKDLPARAVDAVAAGVFVFGVLAAVYRVVEQRRKSMS